MAHKNNSDNAMQPDSNNVFKCLLKSATYSPLRMRKVAMTQIQDIIYELPRTVVSCAKPTKNKLQKVKKNNKI